MMPLRETTELDRWCAHDRRPVAFCHLAKKLATFLPLGSKERAAITKLQLGRKRFAKSQEIVHEGQIDHSAFILLSGWIVSFKLLPDGSRQIISFQVPGDIAGLRSLLLISSDHSFAAITECVVSRIEAADLLPLFGPLPRLAASLLWAASRDEAMIVEHLVNIGRRNPLERTAQFFMELYERLEMVGLASEWRFECPIDQYMLADALGLTAIHINRVLRQLRTENLMTFRGHVVDIHDPTAMRRLAGLREFNPHSRKRNGHQITSLKTNPD